MLRITVHQKRDASVFEVWQMPEFHGQHASACFLILFADDVDPDKELRRYHGLDFEVKSFVKGVKVHSSAPSVWHRGLFRCNFYYSSAIQSEQFKVSTTQGAYW